MCKQLKLFIDVLQFIQTLQGIISEYKKMEQTDVQSETGLTSLKMAFVDLVFGKTCAFIL